MAKNSTKMKSMSLEEMRAGFLGINNPQSLKRKVLKDRTRVLCGGKNFMSYVMTEGLLDEWNIYHKDKQRHPLPIVTAQEVEQAIADEMQKLID